MTLKTRTRRSRKAKGGYENNIDLDEILVESGNVSNIGEFPSRPGSPGANTKESVEIFSPSYNIVRPVKGPERQKATLSRPSTPEMQVETFKMSEIGPVPEKFRRLNTDKNIGRPHSFSPTTIRRITRNAAKRRLTIGGKPRTWSHNQPNSGFSFYSVQEHSDFKNGKEKTVRKEVSIKNGKGVKTVVMRNETGKTRRSTMKIGKNELNKIRQNVFVPGLFKKCLDNCK